MLAFHDYSSLIVNQPLSYPIKGWYLKNHVIIYDTFSPKRFIYPKELSSYLRYFKHLTFSAANIKSFLKVIKLRVIGIEKLLKVIDPELLIVVFNETDSAQYYMHLISSGRFVQSYLDILSCIDTFIGIIRKSFDTIILVSDHSLRLFLKGTNILGTLNDTKLRDMVNLLILSHIVTGLLRYTFFSYERTYKLIRTLRNLKKKLSRTQSSLSLENTPSQLLFDKISPGASSIYFKNKNELEIILKNIKSGLSAYIEDVISLNVNDIPASLIVPRSDLYLVVDAKHRFNRNKILYLPSATHNQYGIFIFWARRMTEHKYVGVINNYDAVPTLLSYLSLPIPSYSNGKPFLS